MSESAAEMDARVLPREHREVEYNATFLMPTDEALLHQCLRTAVDGAMRTPLLVVPLDEWSTASERRLAETSKVLASSPSLSVGVATAEPAPKLRPLIQSLTLSIASARLGEIGRELVGVSDPWDSLAQLCLEIERCPMAAVALGGLLRQTEQMDTSGGLAAEAAVYSMLLAGPEFSRWLLQQPHRVSPECADPVRVDRDGSLLRVELHRPDRRNALSTSMRENLIQALGIAVFDSSVERVLLTGSGPVFCSGGDLAEFGRARDVAAAYLVRLARAPWRLIDALADRTTVYVQGAAIGAGLEMAAFAGDFAIDAHAVLALPELSMGLVPGAGGTVSVTRRIGRWRAAWIMLTGQQVDAETALAWGLVERVTTRG